MSELGNWLDQHDLGKYARAFEANDIDFSTLQELTDGDLRELGLSLGHRRKLLRLIRELAAETHDKRQSGEAERRQITVLFADVVGYTSLSQRLDPEELLDVIKAYQGASGEAVHRYGGLIAKYVGDGLLAFFGWPLASERDAHNAVRSGFAIIDEVKKIETTDGVPLQVRVGIATGLVVVGDLISDAPDVFGEVPNLAERMQALARPGQIIVAETTKRLVDSAMESELLGEFQLKGFHGVVPAWQIVGDRRGHDPSTRNPALSVPLVGREKEIAELRAIWASVCRAEGRTVCIRGEAGFGKSRILSEFLSEIGETAEIVRFFGLPDAGQSALRPIVEHVETLAGFRAEDDGGNRLRKIETMLGRFALDRDVFAPIFGRICGLPVEGYPPTRLSPERQKAMLFEGIGSAFRHVVNRGPVVIVFEDMHWLDPTTCELASYLVKALKDTSTLILMTARPEVMLPIASEIDAHIIDLARLDEANAVKLLLLQPDISGDIGESAVERILERSGGVPLYIEELAKSAHDLREDRATIPITLQDALMARLDRLGNARRIAQMASVIGLDFTAGLLAASLAMPVPVVAKSLDRLVQENILSRSQAPNAEDPTYRFRHVLLAEAAYSSQLRRKRRAAHAAVADALLNKLPMQAKAAPQTIARHLETAGRAAEASPLYRKAGLTALQQAHYQEALGLLRAALATLEPCVGEGTEDESRLRGVELEILSEIGTAQIALEGFGAPGVGKVFDRAEALGRAIGPGPALARALWGLWLFQLVSGKLERAVLTAKELLDLGQVAADSTGDDGLLMEAKWAFGDTLFWMARFDEAHEALCDSISRFDPGKHAGHATLYGQDPYVAAHCYEGYTQWARSDHQGSRAALKIAVDRARVIDHPFSTAWALCFRPVVATWRDEPWIARRLSEAALSHTERQIMPFWQSAMTIVHGWARLRCGEMNDGLDEALRGLELYRAIGSETVQPYFCGLVGECLRIVGDFGRASEMIESGFEMAGRTGECFSEMWLHIHAGRLMFAANEGAEAAESEWRAAISIARRTGAVELELTAAVDLDRLPQNQGHPIWVGPALSRAIAPRKSRAGRRALALMETAQANPPG